LENTPPRYDQLWAPWRLAYVAGDDAPRPSINLPLLPGGDADCFICRDAADTANDRANFVVTRQRQVIVILNRYPYNNGHLLVAPLAHKSRLDQLTAHEHLGCQALLVKLVGLLEEHLRAEGFNIGLNLGRAAGAGLPGHLHWHIVPRWSGDVNFMPVLAAVKVIPQSLDALWELLHNHLPPAGEMHSGGGIEGASVP
jgi:ATP adenylyltransferase